MAGIRGPCWAWLRINEDVDVIVLMLRFCAIVGKVRSTEVSVDLGNEADLECGPS